MSTDEKSTEKFIEGQRVALKAEFRRERPNGEEGVVTHYESYHGLRVWIKALDGLYYAYPEDWLVLLEEVNLVTHFEGMTKAAEEQEAGSISISRRLARGLLDYIAELEAKVPEDFDTTSALKVGDAVVSLIDALDVNRKTQGVVKEIYSEEYPIKVDYEGRKYPVGYKRHELGKVLS